jgi:Ca2+-binding RTX toxin-like protein
MGLTVRPARSWVVDARSGRFEHRAGAALTFDGFESYEVGVRRKRGHATGSVTFLGADVAEQFSSDARRVAFQTAGGDDTVTIGIPNVHVSVAAGPGRDEVIAFGDDVADLVLDLQHGKVRGTVSSGTGFSGSVRDVEDAQVFAGDVRVLGTRAANVLAVTSCTGAVVNAGAGNDRVTLLRPVRPRCQPGSPPRAYGGAGDDHLTGSLVADVLDGGRGHDEADGGEGRDSCRSVETRTSCERR